MPLRVLSAKLSEELIAQLGDRAEREGISRNRLVREALVAAVEGRQMDLSEQGQERDRLAEVRRTIERDRLAMRSIKLGTASERQQSPP